VSPFSLDARHPRPRQLLRHLRALGLLLAFVVTGALGVARADATPFPFVETFRGTTAPAFALGGTPGYPAALTAATGDSDGWLRLTAAETDRFGYAYNRTAFPSGDGLTFTFDYAAWGGVGNGADGLAFVLFDGATTDAQFQPGPAGGALGYTPCATQPGLSNAYMAVGLDEFGNFANTGICQQSGAGNGIVPNRITVRGGVPDYQHLRSVIATQGVAASRANARRVTVTVLPRGGVTTVTATIRYPDGTVQPIATDLPLATPPTTLKFGFTASTGGSVNNHEIRDLQVTKPTDLRVELDPEAGSADRNGVQTYVARVSNAGPNATTGADVAVNAPSTTDVAWTCTASGGATCAAPSGTGVPDGDVGPLPEGGALSFRITARLTDDADDSSLRFAAEPTGDTSELTPADNVAEARTDVTPGLHAAPTLAVSESGLVTATPGSAIGGNLTRSLQWLRCAPDGSDCSPVIGASGPSYQVTDADRDASLRVRDTVTNAAGTASAISAALTLPDTLFAVAPPSPPALAVAEPEDEPAGGIARPPVGSPAPAVTTSGADSVAAGRPSAPLAPSPWTPYAAPTGTGPAGVAPILLPAPTVLPIPASATAAPAARTARADPHRLSVPTTKPFAIRRGLVTGPVRRKLADLAPRLRHASSVRCIDVTDRRRASARNKRAGLRRAQAVCRTLARLGVDATLRSSSRGTARSRATTATTANPKAGRRVEVVARY
jgi:hypothetical protein